MALARILSVLPLFALALAAAACESPNAAKSIELSPQARAAIDRLPAEQRAEAERMLREGPRNRATMNLPVFYIDGERFTKQDPSSPYHVINPDLIATLEVLGPEDGQKRVGPDGRHGVVWITTKAAAAKDATP